MFRRPSLGVRKTSPDCPRTERHFARVLASISEEQRNGTELKVPHLNVSVHLSLGVQVPQTLKKNTTLSVTHTKSQHFQVSVQDGSQRESTCKVSLLTYAICCSDRGPVTANEPILTQRWQDHNCDRHLGAVILP